MSDPVMSDRNPDDPIGEPPAKRPMLSKACETCKQKKSKCDSARPQCNTCRRKGVACIYREKGQPGLRPGYGKALENRLSVLEGTVQEVLHYVRATAMGHPAPPVEATEVPTAARAMGAFDDQPTPTVCHRRSPPDSVRASAMGHPALPPAEDPEVLAAARAMGAFSQPTPTVSHHSPPQDSLTSNTQPQSIQSIHDGSLATAVQAQAQPSPENNYTIAPPDNNTAVAQLPFSQGLSGMSGIDATLPAGDIMEELVELFFELVYPWAPLFHKPTFTANMYSPQHQILLHGIVIITFRFWRKPHPPPELREAYVKTSREQVLLKTVDMCTLTSTQALALLAVDALGQGQGPRTWNVMSMLVCAAKHLCLSRVSVASVVEVNTPLVRNEDPDDGLDLSSIEAEEKRRLYWVIYSIDRLSSVSHGQPGGTDSKSIRLPYPLHDDDWGQQPAQELFQSTGPAKHNHRPNMWHYYIDLLAMVDRSNDLLIQPVNFSIPAHCQEWQSSFRRIDMSLRSWPESLPAEVRERPSAFDPMWIMVHATFHLINIRIYTVAAFPSTTSPYLRPSSFARTRCRQIVRDVSSLVSSLQPHELVQLGPMFAFVVWVAARTLIILWTTGYKSTYRQPPPPADLDLLLGSLRQLSALWPCAKRYADLIQLILDTKNDPGGPTGLDIFNDTRRTAYGLLVRLEMLAGQQMVPEFDFLEMPAFDVADWATPWTSTFAPEIEGDWL